MASAGPITAARGPATCCWGWTTALPTRRRRSSREPSPSDLSSSSGLPLNPRRPALGERLHLLQRRHSGVARIGRQQRAVGPTELERFLRRFAAEQAVEEARGKAVAAADAVV